MGLSLDSQADEQYKISDFPSHDARRWPQQFICKNTDISACPMPLSSIASRCIPLHTKNHYFLMKKKSDVVILHSVEHIPIYQKLHCRISSIQYDEQLADLNDFEQRKYIYLNNRTFARNDKNCLLGFQLHYLLLETFVAHRGFLLSFRPMAPNTIQQTYEQSMKTIITM